MTTGWPFPAAAPDEDALSALRRERDLHKAERRVATDALDALYRVEAALASGLPLQHAARLRGSGRESLDADARVLRDLLGFPALPADPSDLDALARMIPTRPKD